MRLAYVILTYLIAPFLLAHLLWRGRSNPAYRERLAERFGYVGGRLDRPSIWLHAVSVGEVQAAAALVRALQHRYPQAPVVVTTMTPTGSAQARALFGESVVHSFVPYDVLSAVRRFFDWSRPAVAIIMETEIWPNLYNECGRRRIPLFLASARVSPRSVAKYRRLVSLFRETLSHGIVIGAQSEDDAERFRAVGANPARTHVTGNIKFDFELPGDVQENGAALRSFQASDRPVWVAASTHEGEEAQVLAAHREVLGTFPDALLILVPRHPERFAGVRDSIEDAGFTCVTRSSADRCDRATNVLLGDTMGELTTFYAAGDVAFVGGSLVPIGGHNLLEPAALGLPIVTGPHNFNAADIARRFEERGAKRVVSNPAELARIVCELFEDPAERDRIGKLGRSVLEENRGALGRLLALVDPLIEAELSKRDAL